MTDGDNPDTGNAGSASESRWMTADQGTEKLAALFAAETAEPTIPEDKDQDTPDAEAEGGDGTPDDAADEAEGTEETETEEDGEEGSSVELSDDTEIDLGDGTRTTFADLKAAKKQVKEFQRDYSRKTEALAEDRRVVESKAQTVIERAQQLQAERETFLSVIQEFLPAPPQRPSVSPSEDPIAWVEYQSAKEDYEGKIGKLQAVHNQRLAAQQKAAEEQQAKMPEIVAQEREKLLARRPHLKDPQIAAKTKAEMASIISEKYGFSPDEIANVADSRAVEMMLDLLDYQRIKNAAPAAKAKVETKPPLVKAAKRQSAQSQAERERQTLRNRHRQTGRVDDAVAILKSWNL